MNILEVHNLTKSYQQAESRIEILKGISFGLEMGSTVSIVGQSGSGKSTLLALLAGMDQADSGEILVNGQDLTQLSAPDLTRFRGKNIGIIFQQFHLMPHLTALENVSLPLEILSRPQPIESARQALLSVGLSHRENHLPIKMSGGECQRVAIARALVVKPKILLADEPSGNLDAKTGDQVMDLLFALVKENQSTMLLVTHNLELAHKCHSVLELVEGRLSQVQR